VFLAFSYFGLDALNNFTRLPSSFFGKCNMSPAMLAITFGFFIHNFPNRVTRLKRPLPRSSTPNRLWPHGWDFAGERDVPVAVFGIAPKIVS
jgi:hypothetical protein